MSLNHFLDFIFIASYQSCWKDDTITNKVLEFITFKNGSALYSNKSASEFGFITNYQQVVNSSIKQGMFAFTNRFPNGSDTWYHEALDHTDHDDNGYMLLINEEPLKPQLFSYKMNHLCVGLHYEFFAYVANIGKEKYRHPKPNIRLEIRAMTEDGNSIASMSTDNIAEYQNITWLKNGLSFIATNRSVVLSILLDKERRGEGERYIAIDDIRLSVCSKIYAGLCFPSEYISLNNK